MNLDKALMKKIWSKKKFPKFCEVEIDFKLKLIKFDELPIKNDVYKAIYFALRNLHGLMGVCHEFKLTSYNAKQQTGVIVVSVEGLKKLWSSISLISEIESTPCAFILNNIKMKEEEETIPSTLSVI